MSGAYTGVLNGTGENNRVTLTINLLSGGTITFNSSGQVLKTQLEFANYPTSYIQTTQSGGVTRAQTGISISNLYTNGITSSQGGT